MNRTFLFQGKRWAQESKGAFVLWIMCRPHNTGYMSHLMTFWFRYTKDLQTYPYTLRSQNIYISLNKTHCESLWNNTLAVLSSLCVSFCFICQHFNYPAHIFLAQNCFNNLQQTDVPNTQINANAVHIWDEKKKYKNSLKDVLKQQVHHI